MIPRLEKILQSLQHLQEAETYDSRKTESARIDAELGLEIEKVEESIRARLSSRTNWAKLSPQVFQTPYAEFAEIIGRVDPAPLSSRHWIDLGAAYGRLAWVLALLRPHSTFSGIELEKDRVEEGVRVLRGFGLTSPRLECGDLNQIPIPRGDYYFIYDFGTEAEIERVISALREFAREVPVTLVGRGRRVRDLVERHHPWLSEIIRPEHSAHYSIYRSAH